MTATFMYKCRMCGEVFKGISIGGSITNLEAFGMICDTMYNKSVFERPDSWVSHTHADGAGIADLVGLMMMENERKRNE